MRHKKSTSHEKGASYPSCTTTFASREEKNRGGRKTSNPYSIGLPRELSRPSTLIGREKNIRRAERGEKEVRLGDQEGGTFLLACGKKYSAYWKDCEPGRRKGRHSQVCPEREGFSRRALSLKGEEKRGRGFPFPRKNPSFQKPFPRWMRENKTRKNKPICKPSSEKEDLAPDLQKKGKSTSKECYLVGGAVIPQKMFTAHQGKGKPRGAGKKRLTLFSGGSQLFPVEVVERLLGRTYKKGKSKKGDL